MSYQLDLEQGIVGREVVHLNPPKIEFGCYQVSNLAIYLAPP